MQTRRWLLLLAGLTVVALPLLPASRAAAQEPTVHIELPSTQVAADGGPFTVSLIVEDVTNLGAFQFDLTYDSAVLTSAGIEGGPFLGSSGRQVQCLPPRMEEGLVGLTCVTLGATPAGPDGSGVLASITFQPVASGSSSLHLARLTLTDPPGQPLPSRAEDTTLAVSPAQGSGEEGFAWALWGPIIGGVVLVVAAAGGFVWWLRRPHGA
jgi:hypothetical protein